MEFQLRAEDYGNVGRQVVVNVTIDLAEFDKAMDATAVKELLDIIVCDDYAVIDIDEQDLYVTAEKIYQELQARE